MASEIVQSILQFSNFLQAENKDQETKLKELKINEASRRVADTFEQLGPDASESDLRRASFNTLKMAADWNVLPEVQNLVQSQYATGLDLADRLRKQKETELLRQQAQKFTRGNYDLSGLSAEDLRWMTTTYIGQDKGLEVTDRTGITTWKEIDASGKINRSIVIDERTDKQKLNMELSKIYARESASGKTGADFQQSTYTWRDAGGVERAVGYDKNSNTYWADVNGQQVPVPTSQLVKQGSEPQLSQPQLMANIKAQVDTKASDILASMGITPPSGTSAREFLLNKVNSRGNFSSFLEEDNKNKKKMDSKARGELWNKYQEFQDYIEDEGLAAQNIAVKPVETMTRQDFMKYGIDGKKYDKHVRDISWNFTHAPDETVKEAIVDAKLTIGQKWKDMSSKERRRAGYVFGYYNDEGKWISKDPTSTNTTADDWARWFQSQASVQAQMDFMKVYNAKLNSRYEQKKTQK